MEFPKNDDQYTEDKIDGVERQSDGTYSIECGGWHLWCGADWKGEPKVGQIARKYGRGIGAAHGTRRRTDRAAAWGHP